MSEFSDKTRSSNLQNMQDQVLDLLIIGGGITGSGIALDAQSRNLKTGLLEMRDFASGTSSRSTKLVHGGLRYLKQAAVKEVHEVGSERAIVYNNAPHVTTPLKMMLPFYEDGTFGPFTTAIGLDVYDRLAEVKHSERKYMLNSHDTLEREPYIKAEGLKGSGVYVEYRTDDARLTLEVLKKANDLGALVANYIKVTGLLYDADDKICGVIFKDLITEKTGEIHAKKVINATGPWVDNIREMDHSNTGKHLHLTKGVHLVIDHDKFPISNSIYFDTPFHDDRMMFAIPREGKTYIGTTDTTWTKDPKEPSITATDVTYILAAANQMFDLPEFLTPEDVESGWSGVRPLIQEEGKSPSEISRKDEIFQSKSGLLSIAGGTVVDLAVGVIVGAAFNSLVSAITTYLLNPLIGLIIGQIDLSDMKFQVLGATFLIGDFINAVINFLIIMFVVFLIVKMMNRMRRDGSRSKFDQNGDEIPDPQTEYLQQIRDLLRYQQRNDHNNRRY